MIKSMDMFDASVIPDRWELLDFGLAQRANYSGHICEFGVFRGKSLNYIAEHVGGHVVHGFDSFEGLPEDWDQGPRIIAKGAFNCHKPTVLPNVMLHEGWVEDSVKPWMENYGIGPISFIHFDLDIYSATKYVLSTVNHKICNGTIFVFDELGAFEKGHSVYPNWPAGEWRALLEWTTECNRTVEFLARDLFYRVAIKVTN